MHSTLDLCLSHKVVLFSMLKTKGSCHTYGSVMHARSVIHICVISCMVCFQQATGTFGVHVGVTNGFTVLSRMFFGFVVVGVSLFCFLFRMLFVLRCRVGMGPSTHNPTQTIYPACDWRAGLLVPLCLLPDR